MEKIKFFYCILTVFFFGISNAQSLEIDGKVMAEDEDVEGIHVINKTSNTFTITRENGSFTIPVQLNDTIVFSAIKYKPKEITVNYDIIKSKKLNVYLTELINELDEVIVGKVLTGNLMSDIKNSDAKRDINFYDFGIPGYTGKPATISENRLKEATTGGGFLPLNPILNYFSGRTKQLKNQVKLERSMECLESIKSNLGQVFFENNDLPEVYRAEFFYYCLEDEQFSTLCILKNDIKTLEFLKSKLDNYKMNLQVKKD